MSLAQSIAESLGGAKRSNRGWQCRCPCHDDKQASLGVIDYNDSVIVNCLAGCSWSDIKTELKGRGLLKDKYDRAISNKRNFYSRMPSGVSRASSPIVHNVVHQRAVRVEDDKSNLTKIRELASGGTAKCPTVGQLGQEQGVIKYTYQDAEGKPVARKLRYPGKKFKIERYEGWRWLSGLNGIECPLYNLPKVLASDIVYLCEGEKDADNLNKLGMICATTNIAGGDNWRDSYNANFTGKTVVILEDNDETGRKRTAKLSKALNGIAAKVLVFRPPGVPEKGDVTDWLEAGGRAKDILGLSVEPSVEALQDELPETSIGENGDDNDNNGKRKAAKQQDYFDLFNKILENPRRCIFNDKLMYWDKSHKTWNPAINQLDLLKSAALVENETTKKSAKKFNTAYVLPHFCALEASKEPEFLVDIPKWDGEDRIKAMCELMRLNPRAGISQQSLEELVKEWCAKVFLRLVDSRVQNTLLAFVGSQGIGKDYWISMLLDGLGQYCTPISVLGEDKDTYINLSRSLVLKVSELDKTARVEVSVLKDIITAPSTNIRAPYDRDSKVRVNRCSFISSANVRSLLRDTTGNRRYWIFEVEHITYGYEGWSSDKIKEWQMQCLAQMVVLAAKNYKASEPAAKEMRDYIDQETPEDPADTFLADFMAELKSDIGDVGGISLKWDKDRRVPTSDKTIQEIINRVAHRTGVKPAWAKMLLYQKIGLRTRVGNHRFRMYEIPQFDYKRDDDLPF